jgi:hypothetical protein
MHQAAQEVGLASPVLAQQGICYPSAQLTPEPGSAVQLISVPGREYVSSGLAALGTLNGWLDI